MRISVLIALGAVAVASACECPQAYIALLEGKSVVASGTHGHLHVPDCCDGVFNNNSWTGGEIEVKNTPGAACKVLQDCGSCTLMNFCKWGGDPTTPDCADVNHIADENVTHYSNACDSRGEFNPAEVVDLDAGQTDFQKTALYHADNNTYLQQYQGNRTAAESPHLEMGVGNFAGMFDGYLPPAACSHSNEVGERSPACAGFKDDGVAFVYPQFY